MVPISRVQKNELLSKYQDHEDEEEDCFEEEDVEEGNREGRESGFGTIRPDHGDDFYGIDENFQTLTIKGNDLATLRANMAGNSGAGGGGSGSGGAAKFSLKGTHTPMLRPEGSTNDMEEDFLAGFEDLSPGTISTSSPKLKRGGRGSRKSLSEYSEEIDTDTDVTSEFNDADMRDIDNIFGFEESGVYSSGGQNITSKATGPSRAKAMLQLKKKEMEIQAKQEEQEILAKHGGVVGLEKTNTLRLKDFNAYQDKQFKIDMDALENEKTINYEYTRDDYEDFEDGFELNSPLKIPTKMKSGDSGKRVTNKMSMPQFDLSVRRGHLKKYKSMMDVAIGEENEEVEEKEEEEEVEENEHPFFNHKHNNLMKKLNRIPSFYSKEKKSGGVDNLDMIEELVSNNEKYSNDLDLEMEMKKQKLLEKYMEITNHQLRNIRDKSKRSPGKKKLGSNIGLVRYLSDQSVPVYDKSNKMKYNAAKHRWEGNDIDLYKFEKIKSLPTSKPRLIANVKPIKGINNVGDRGVGNSGGKVVGNMRYDPVAMKWINEDEDEDRDIFNDLPDLPSESKRRNKEVRGISISKSHPNLRKESNPVFPKSGSTKSIISMLKSSPSKYSLSNPGKFLRGVSTTSAFTQRTTSSTSTTSNESDSTEYSENTPMQPVMQELYLDDKLIEKFYKEESKWFKKTKNWFNEGELFNFGSNNSFNRDYYWEIRKMVTDEES